MTFSLTHFHLLPLFKGFFGIDAAELVNLEVLIDSAGFNVSTA